MSDNDKPRETANGIGDEPTDESAAEAKPEDDTTESAESDAGVLLARKVATRAPGPGATPAADRDSKRGEILRAQRRANALALKMRGLGNAESGERLGVSREQIRLDIDAAIAEIGKESREECAAFADATLRKVVNAHAERMTTDPKSADVVIKALSTWAKLRGINAPDRVEHTGKDGDAIKVADGAKEDVLSRIARLATALGAGADRPKPDAN